MALFSYQPKILSSRHSSGKLRVGILFPVLLAIAILWYIGMANSVVGASFNLSAQEEDYLNLRAQVEKLEQEVATHASAPQLQESAQGLDLVVKAPTAYIVISPTDAAVADAGGVARP